MFLKIRLRMRLRRADEVLPVATTTPDRRPSWLPTEGPFHTIVSSMSSAVCVFVQSEPKSEECVHLAPIIARPQWRVGEISGGGFGRAHFCAAHLDCALWTAHFGQALRTSEAAFDIVMTQTVVDIMLAGRIRMDDGAGQSIDGVQ